MKKFLFAALIVGGMVLGYFVSPLSLRVDPSGNGTAKTVPAVSGTAVMPSGNPSSTAASQESENAVRPATLTIPKLDVDVPVEHVSMDKKGNMDVPKNADNVAWFQIGYLPGSKGNSVLAGHFDKSDGKPAVFYKLKEMEAGDTFMITGEDGRELEFTVTGKDLYPSDDFPVAKVFGPSQEKLLNLITCDGAWDAASRNYSNRLVVSAKLNE